MFRVFVIGCDGLVESAATRSSAAEAVAWFREKGIDPEVVQWNDDGEGFAIRKGE